MKKILAWAAISTLVSSALGACSSDAVTPTGSAGASSSAGKGGTNAGGVSGAAAAGISFGGSAGATPSLGGTGGAPGAAGSAGGAAIGGTGGGSAGIGGGSAGTGGASTGGGTGGSNGSVIDQLLTIAKQPCAKVVSTHDYALDDNSKAGICATTGAVFWTADMDIDCDGKMTAECNASTDCCYQNDTAFHNAKDEPLTASVTPYVVIPQDFKYANLENGTVIAVIYNHQITYAVWGDTGPTDIIGEASYATAKSLGINPDAKTGGVGGKVVTYIAFLGKQAVPKDLEDRAAVETLGAQLAQALITANP